MHEVGQLFDTNHGSRIHTFATSNERGEINSDVKFANNKKVKEEKVSLDPEPIL